MLRPRCLVAALSRGTQATQPRAAWSMRSSPHAKEPDMTRPRCLRVVATSIALTAALPAIAQSDPGKPAPRRFEHLRQALSGGLDDGADSTRQARVPDGVRRVADIPYGGDKAQRFDVYVSSRAPASLAPAPVIFFVHGGGWAFGDKSNHQVIEPKVAHWVAQGYVVISTNCQGQRPRRPRARAARRSLARRDQRDAGCGFGLHDAGRCVPAVRALRPTRPAPCRHAAGRRSSRCRRAPPPRPS